MKRALPKQTHQSSQSSRVRYAAVIPVLLMAFLDGNYLEAAVKAGTYKAEYFTAVSPFRQSNFGGHLGKSPDSIKPAQPVRQSYHSEAATVIPRGLPDTPLDRRIAESQRQELARKKNAHAPTPSE